jgi:hypothetical protein
MSTVVEKRMLSIEEIEAQTALVLPERELMWHHKHHKRHHHHQQQVQIVIICINNHDHNHNHMGQTPWDNNGQWGGQDWRGNNFENNQSCFPIGPNGFFPQTPFTII